MVTNAQGQAWDSNFMQYHTKSRALVRAMRPRCLRKPMNVTAPNISGATTLGATLTATTGTWNYQPMSYTYQWMRAGTPIAGATASTHVIVAADQGGKAVTCVVTAINGRGSASATSNTITVP
jgi:hypothetical protein